MAAVSCWRGQRLKLLLNGGAGSVCRNLGWLRRGSAPPQLAKGRNENTRWACWGGGNAAGGHAVLAG